MMKKLLLLCTAVFAVNFAAKAQMAVGDSIVINDTLRYFDNKQLLRLPVSTVHPTYKLVSSATTNTNVTMIGSVFKNNGTVVIKGLEARVLRPNLTITSTPNGVPFRLYLCNVNASGMPILPPLDSVSGSVLVTTALQFGQTSDYNFGTAKTVTGNFAILARCTSTITGDTVKFFRTAGYTANASNAPSNANKFGEGLGLIRNNGTWMTTTNSTANGFGTGTDYEFCLAPIVQFSAAVSEQESPAQSGACCWTPFTNTNTSTSMLKNQMFNYNEFYRVWKPFATTPNFVPDSAFVWDLGDNSPKYYTPHGVDLVQLNYGGGQCDMAHTGSLVAYYKGSASVNSPVYSSSVAINGFALYCNDSLLSGIQEFGSLASVKVYPNPTVDKTIITGLKGKNTVQLYDMLGQVVSTQVTENENCVVDMIKYPRGNYFIRINNTAENKSRAIKVIKE